jgi:putative transposase
MILAHKIALDPTVKQRVALSRACGVARFTWNWALAEWNKDYGLGEKPDYSQLRRRWNTIKGELFPWVYDSPKDANQQPFVNLNKAFGRFFKKTSKRPQFKKKGVHDSFYVSNDRITVVKNAVSLPVIGEIKTRESLRLKGRIMAAAVSREVDRWFLSVQVEGDFSKERVSSREAGIDLGLKTSLVFSDGETVKAPNPLKTNLKRLQRRNRKHSRKQKGSRNKKKSQHRLAKLHARVKSIRRDWQHKTTTEICKNHAVICLEDLNVKGMAKNPRLSRAISDAGWGELRRQLEYKAKLYGSKVIIIDRWTPTSKICSSCGHKKEVFALSERTFNCDKCGLSLDRDLNAAINICTAGLAGNHACGPEGSDGGRKPAVKPLGDETGTRPGAPAMAFPT